MHITPSCDILSVRIFLSERGTLMELDIKTVSFGGYDKRATETYVLEQQKHYEDEIC